MKYYFFSFWGDGLPIAYKLQQEGHEVLIGLIENQQDTLAPEEQDGKREHRLEKAIRMSLYGGMLQFTSARKLLLELKHKKKRDDCFVFFEFNNLFKYAEQVR